MTRIFIAIQLSECFKQPLLEAQGKLRELGVTGNYPPKDNLHLTISFIGFTDKVDLIKQAMSEIKFEPFTITTSNLGCFNTERVKVLWMGVEESEPLQSLATAVRQKLQEYGIGHDLKPYAAHITLVSKPSTFITDLKTSPAQMLVEKISVMESISESTGPVYVER